jgi:small subunit ribosomal protein S4
VARYLGAVCRHCRREGQKLFLKGQRCYTDKCAVERKPYPPGSRGATGKRGKLSEFGTQLREKQKVRRVYGMLEKQFRLFFDRASRVRGVTSDIFFRSLELRLDNAIYRMGFARSRNEARQLVRHNHILVNDRRLNIPSAQLSVGDIVRVKESSQSKVVFAEVKENSARRPAVAWVEVDHDKMTAKVIAAPTREDIQLPVKDRLIVELYSK